MKLKFGLHLATHGFYDYQNFLNTAILADNLGYEYITIGDHFFNVPPNVGGNPNEPHKLDTYTTLAALAAKTNRAKLGARVSPLPFYQPTRLAKMLTTIDIISGGRVILGAGAGGAGHFPKDNEFLRSGVGWFKPKERIRRMRETIEIILKLWSDEKNTSYKGKYYQIVDMPFWPKPIQKPHPPIWFGGSGNDLLNVAVKYGAGIFPFPNSTMLQLRDLNNRIRKIEKEQDRKNNLTIAPSLIYPDAIGTSPTQWSENIKAVTNIGAELIMIDFSQRAIGVAAAQEFIRKFATFLSDFNE